MSRRSKYPEQFRRDAIELVNSSDRPLRQIAREADVEAWAAGLEDLFALVAGRFSRAEPRRRARAYVRGLLAPPAGENGWTLAEVAGDATPTACSGC